MADKYILGYGSLMNLESASRALKRNVLRSNISIVKLLDFQRTWTVKESVFSEKLNKIIQAAFLDIQPYPGKYLNAVIFAVSENELSFLTKREKNYELVEVTNLTHIKDKEFDNKLDRIFTFTSKLENRVKSKETNIYILQKYIEIVENACLVISNHFQKEFLNTTEIPSFEVISGKYSFVDEQQKKFA